MTSAAALPFMGDSVPKNCPIGGGTLPSMMGGGLVLKIGVTLFSVAGAILLACVLIGTT